MKAPPLPVIYILVLLALFAAALMIHLHATTISLPLGALSIPTIVLPLLAALNSYLHAQLTSFLSTASHVRDPSTRRRRRRTLTLVRTSTQSIQGVLAVALATLLLQRIIPNESLACSLENAWNRMWKGHDAAGIRAVEEALHCCGFRSLKDRPWPFPHGDKGDLDMCRLRMGYTVPCEGPWRAQLQRSAFGDFAIVAIVCFMQVGNILVYARYFGRLRPWFSETGPLIVPADDDEDINNTNNSRRPLLPASSSSDRRDRLENGRVGRIIEEEGDDDEDGEGRRLGGGGGAAANGSMNGGGGRVYPSGIAGGASAVQSLQQQHAQDGNVWSSSRGRRGSNSSLSSSN